MSTFPDDSILVLIETVPSGGPAKSAAGLLGAAAGVGTPVALIVAVGQGFYAFAPAAFGLVRELTPHAGGMAPGEAPGLFAAAAAVQALAIGAFLAGRQR